MLAHLQAMFGQWLDAMNEITAEAERQRASILRGKTSDKLN